MYRYWSARGGSCTVGANSNCWKPTPSAGKITLRWSPLSTPSTHQRRMPSSAPGDDSHRTYQAIVYQRPYEIGVAVAFGAQIFWPYGAHSVFTMRKCGAAGPRRPV